MARRKIITVVGARPQFIKLAPVEKALKDVFDHLLVHTGQHYDDTMSRVFFDGLALPVPDYSLGVGSVGHAEQTGTMMMKLEEVLVKERPDVVIVYGDTNSTLAGALAASKLHIRLAHIEAGLRSFNRKMPEEINRVVVDHISDFLFCPTPTAMANLQKESISKAAHYVGDVMLDALLSYSPLADRHADILEKFHLGIREYYLATVHRASNTDDVKKLSCIIEAFAALDLPVLFPVHPRTRSSLDTIGVGSSIRNVRFVEPVGYLEMLVLERSARKILTDSGGVQKEAYWLKTPCVTLREETEWVETVADGWNTLAGTDPEAIVTAAMGKLQPDGYAPHFGDGDASEKVCEILQASLT